ncbi:MAG: sugar phosphate isomerase/epimerase family protein [Armatimonadia bacterium]
MQISFMTWACPDWTLTEVLTGAIKYGYDSVEPRVEAKQKHGIDLDTTKKVRKEIKASFADTGVRCCCLATSRTFSMEDPEKRRESVELTKRYVDLARDIDCPNLRVFGGPTPKDADFAEVKKYVTEAFRECCEHAAKSGVSLCFETHDSYCHSADALEVVRGADHPQAAICWDVMHPFRVGESFEETFANVKDYVRHCHVHDGVKPADGGAGGWEMALMGEGDIPHQEPFKLLAGIGYTGALSGEWINFLPPDEVLPHDARVMREYRAAATR